MQVTGEWLSHEATQKVMLALEAAGFQAYAVGGCVRNALLGAPIADVDISSNATPEQVIEVAENAGFKAVPTGIDHGTITVVCDHEPFEITTFRKDVATDGRRAVVEFSQDMRDDAVRRDFTVNALYVQADGTLHDPLGGMPDIEARRIRFIEDADKRIEEDYLRILRFFRFHAWYGDPEKGLDANGLAACATHVEGIAQLSKERLGAEMSKLLAAPDPAPSVASMAACGALGQVIAGADNSHLAALVHLEGELPPRWQRRLAVLGGEDVANALRLSKADARYLSDIKQVLQSEETVEINAYRYGADQTLDAKLVEAATLAVPIADDLSAKIAQGAEAKFPLRATDLMDKIDAGPALGAEMKRLERVWMDSHFSLSKTELLAR